MGEIILKGAIIGCGRIAHKHVDAFLKNSEKMQMIACCDIIPQRAEGIRDEYKSKAQKEQKKILQSINVYQDYKELIEKEKPSFVIVSTESGYHADIAVFSLEHDVHVICEKPMALSIEDADKMIASSEKSGKALCVSFQNRFNSPIQRTRQALEKGRFGKLLHGVASIRWNRGMDYYKQAPWRGTWKLDGGTLMNQCTHNIDLLQWMMGEDAVEVYGVTHRYMRDIEAEDFGTGIIRFASGATGIIEGTADIYPKNLEETLFLSGTKGTVKIGGLAVNQIENWRFSDSDEFGDTEEQIVGKGYELEDNSFQAVYGYGHASLYNDFYNSIVQGKKLLVDGSSGKRALEIILALYKSQKTGQPVPLPLKNFSTLDMSGQFN